MQAHPDNWLSDIFGYPCWKLTGEGEVPKLEGKCFAWARVEETKTRGELVRYGFLPMSNHLTFASMDVSIDKARPWPCYVRDAGPSDLPELQNLVGRFLYDRFSEDPYIPPRKAVMVKKEWIRSGWLGKRGHGMAVAKWYDDIVGFLLYEEFYIGHIIPGPQMRIDLICTGYPRVAKALVGYVMDKSGAHGLFAGSQASNAKAIKFYRRIGLDFTGTQYVLHYHGE